MLFMNGILPPYITLLIPLACSHVHAFFVSALLNLSIASTKAGFTYVTVINPMVFYVTSNSLLYSIILVCLYAYIFQMINKFEGRDLIC